MGPLPKVREIRHEREMVTKRIVHNAPLDLVSLLAYSGFRQDSPSSTSRVQLPTQSISLARASWSGRLAVSIVHVVLTSVEGISVAGVIANATTCQEDEKDDNVGVISVLAPYKTDLL
jgi:hypothetical protein